MRLYTLAKSSQSTRGEGVQTKARVRRVLVILAFLFQNFGFSFQNFGFFFQNFDIFFQKLRPFRMYLSPVSIRRVCRWFCRVTRDDSQARLETLWLVHHGPLKKCGLNETRHERRGYTRGSRRVFPFTFSLSSCLGFPRRECTAGIRYLTSPGMSFINFKVSDKKKSVSTLQLHTTVLFQFLSLSSECHEWYLFSFFLIFLKFGFK